MEIKPTYSLSCDVMPVSYTPSTTYFAQGASNRPLALERYLATSCSWIDFGTSAYVLGVSVKLARPWVIPCRSDA